MQDLLQLLMDGIKTAQWTTKTNSYQSQHSVNFVVYHAKISCGIVIQMQQRRPPESGSEKMKPNDVLSWKTRQKRTPENGPEKKFNWTLLSYQRETIAKIILTVSKHANISTQISWEGLYVALSKLKFNDDICLLLKYGDRATINYEH